MEEEPQSFSFFDPIKYEYMSILSFGLWEFEPRELMEPIIYKESNDTVGRHKLIKKIEYLNAEQRRLSTESEEYLRVLEKIGYLNLKQRTLLIEYEKCQQKIKSLSLQLRRFPLLGLGRSQTKEKDCLRKIEYLSLEQSRLSTEYQEYLQKIKYLILELKQEFEMDWKSARPLKERDMESCRKKSQQLFRTAAIESKVLVLGNAGVGKSTILNCLFKKEVFQTGISFEKSVTQVTQEFVIDGLIIVDTPGFDDSENRVEAAKEIKKALSYAGLYKILFVITLESGRFRAIDKKTLNEVLEAFSIRDNAYSIVVNKIEQPVLNQIADDYETFMAQLHEGPSAKTERVFCLPYDHSIAKNYSLPHLKEQFSDFIRGAPMTEIILDSGKDQDMCEIGNAATRAREKTDFLNQI